MKLRFNEYLKTRQGINRQEARYNVELEKLIEVLKEKVSANKEV